MTSGRGFLALSLVLLARWNPLGALLASLLLGLAFTAEVRLTTWAVLRESERQDFLVFALRCLPYLVTVTVLAGLGPGRRPPAALGQPH
jgi:simple sugar transport system permease protein